MLTPWKESYNQPRQHIKKQRHYFVNKGPSSQGYGFSSGHVWMWQLDCKESWVLKNWCFWIVVLEKTVESLWDYQDIQPFYPKGDQSWVFIGRTGVEAETPILWPPNAKSWLIWKHPAAGKDWRQKQKGTTEHEMVGWYHRLNGHGFGWTLGVGDGQGGLVCCSYVVVKSWTWLSDLTDWNHLKMGLACGQLLLLGLCVYAQLLLCPYKFSRQEYWIRLLFPTTGDLLDPGIEPGFLQLAGRFFTTVPPGKP